MELRLSDDSSERFIYHETNIIHVIKMVTKAANVGAKMQQDYLDRLLNVVGRIDGRIGNNQVLLETCREETQLDMSIRSELGSSSAKIGLHNAIETVRRESKKLGVQNRMDALNGVKDDLFKEFPELRVAYENMHAKGNAEQS